MKTIIISTADIMLLDYVHLEKPRIGDTLILQEGKFKVVDRIFRLKYDEEKSLDIIVEPVK